jgi:hypothetical protein
MTSTRDDKAMYLGKECGIGLTVELLGFGCFLIPDVGNPFEE